MQTEKDAITGGNYPHYPLLPMKRWKDGNLECGIVIAPRWNMIIIANIWLLTDPESIKNAKIILYASLDELLLDGWTGD